MKRLVPYARIQDSRGSFTGLMNSGLWEEMNLIETESGCVRGGHFHEHTTELFFILSGEIELEVSRPGGPLETHRLRKGDILLVEPGESHTFRCLTKCEWINVLSKRMEPSAPDICVPRDGVGKVGTV